MKTPKRDSTLKKHQAIRAEFDRLSNVKTSTGKRKYTSAGIVAELAEKFFYSDKTIENIIYS